MITLPKLAADALASFLAADIDDRFGVASRGFLEMDNVMWECDYPHSDATWPTSPESLMKGLHGVSDHDIDRISHLNAMRHFHYDPFTTLGGRAACTVGSLRAQVAGRDVSIRPQAREGVAKRGTLASDLAAAATSHD